MKMSSFTFWYQMFPAFGEMLHRVVQDVFCDPFSEKVMQFVSVLSSFIGWEHTKKSCGTFHSCQNQIHILVELPLAMRCRGEIDQKMQALIKEFLSVFTNSTGKFKDHPPKLPFKLESLLDDRAVSQNFPISPMPLENFKPTP